MLPAVPAGNVMCRIRFDEAIDADDVTNQAATLTSRSGGRLLAGVGDARPADLHVGAGVRRPSRERLRPAGRAGREDLSGGALVGHLHPVDDRADLDVQRFRANAGDELVIRTTTPGAPDDDPLDPVVELYDTTGTRAAADDNGAADGRNVLLTHTADRTASAATMTGTGTLTWRT